MVNRTIQWLTFALVATLPVLIGGCCSLTTNGSVQTVDVAVSAGVQVLDVVNNTPVNGVPVYFVAYSPNSTGSRDIHETDVTGDDGWALFSVNYTLEKGECIYLGASNVKPLVESDFAGKSFNGSGYLGEWKSFNYSMLYNSENKDAAVGCTITIDRDTGGMI
jgi:hypothetical protein